MGERPFRHLCSEADLRDAMTDDEFWAHVARSLNGDRPEDEYDPAHEAIDLGLIADPCPECGAAGACGWDDEGRPLIHATSEAPR
jgi:hypothetical protein